MRLQARGFGLRSLLQKTLSEGLLLAGHFIGISIPNMGLELTTQESHAPLAEPARRSKALTPSSRMCPPSAFLKFALCRFTFMKDLHWYLFLLTERNLKRIFTFPKKSVQSKNCFQRLFCGEWL